MTPDYLEAAKAAMEQPTRDSVWWATLLISRVFLVSGSAKGLGVGPAAAAAGFEESDALLLPLDGAPLPEALLERIVNGTIETPAHLVNTVTRHLAYGCLTYLRSMRRESDALGRYVRRRGLGPQLLDEGASGAPILFIDRGAQ